MRNFICLAVGISFAIMFFSVNVLGTVEITDPATVSELNLNIVQDGKIIASTGIIEWANITVAAPQKTPTQTVVTTQDTIVNEIGSQYFNYFIENPPTPITYSTQSTVTVRSQRTKYIPGTYTIPEDIIVFLEATDTIQSDNAEIKALADSILKDAKNDFEKIALLSTWVTENVEYDLAYRTKAYDALWVLKNEVGVCSEFATLFIAFARSQGIPTRYVSGWAYGEKGWEPHAYAESYLGVWVPVDPTWNEVGHLDATHVKFSHQLSNEVSNKIKVSGMSVGTITWLEDNTELEILDFKEDEKQEDYELIKSAEVLEAGDDAVVVLKFEPEEYKVVKLSLLPCAGTYSIADIDDVEKNIILSPGKETVVSWTVHINPSLDPNMIYTCPLTLNSRLLTRKSINLVVDTAAANKKTNTVLSLDVSSPVLVLGDSQSIYAELRGTTGEDVIYAGVVLEDDVIEQTTIGDGTMEFTFTPKSAGEKEVIAYTSTGIVKTVEFTVIQTGDVVIDSVVMPDDIKIGDRSEAVVTLKNNRANAQGMTLYVTADGKDSAERLSFLGAKNVTVPLSFEDTGIKKIRFLIKGDDFEHSTTKQIEVFEVPAVDIKASYDYNTNEGIFTVTAKNYRADDVVVSIAGNKIDFGSVYGEKTMREPIEVGAHTIIVEYMDASGKEYSFEKDIVVKKDNIISRIIRAIIEFFSQIKVM
ncbi:MAG: transglutaminase domain-containing protein [Candidatus Aenigmarchaeota archaeon]|nr:transglutaminase domain-containing protein [Candidatus Aenigmarchaeota archaeon]